MLKFESNIHKHGHAKRSESIPFEFTLEEGKVHFMTTSCHCTGAKYDPETRKVTGYLNLAKAVRKGSIGDVDRGITVYEDDGLPIYEVDDDYVLTFNNKKAHKVLTIVATVVGE
jgi:hypothetical protein